MAKTYAQIQQQIENLQLEAERLKASEVAGVVERIKIAIAHYGLTAEHLFGAGKPNSSKSRRGMIKKVSGPLKVANSAAYADGNGNVWGGRGPRPKWLRDAIAGGKLLEDFSTGALMPKSTPDTTVKSTGKRTAKNVYRDDSGNSWSGFGPKPAWLKAALAAGKSLEDLASPSKN